MPSEESAKVKVEVFEVEGLPIMIPAIQVKCRCGWEGVVTDQNACREFSKGEHLPVKCCKCPTVLDVKRPPEARIHRAVEQLNRNQRRSAKHNGKIITGPRG